MLSPRVAGPGGDEGCGLLIVFENQGILDVVGGDQLLIEQHLVQAGDGIAELRVAVDGDRDAFAGGTILASSSV